VAALLFGLKAAVLAIVLEAVFRIGKRALKNNILLSLAAAAFIGIFFFDIPFPVIVFVAALIGFIGAASGAAAFQGGAGHGGTAAGGATDSLRPHPGSPLRVGAVVTELTSIADADETWRPSTDRPRPPRRRVFLRNRPPRRVAVISATGRYCCKRIFEHPREQH